MACSSTAEHSTVNRRVEGSKPSTPAIDNMYLIYYNNHTETDARVMEKNGKA